MDLVIENYLDDAFSPEMAFELRRSCTLFEQFNLRDYQLPLIDILMSALNDHPESIYDQVIASIRSNQESLFAAHLVTLDSEATLFERNEILTALHALQDLEAYDSIISVLESDLSPEEQLSEVMSQCCRLDLSRVFTLLKSVEISLLETLKQFIYQKESVLHPVNMDQQTKERGIISTMKLFKRFLKDQSCLGIKLLEHEVLMLRPIQMYLSFIGESFKQSNPLMLAIDAYSFLLLTAEGHQNPLDAFHTHGYLLIDDVETVSKVDVQLTKLINDFERFKQKTAEQSLPVPA